MSRRRSDPVLRDLAYDRWLQFQRAESRRLRAEGAARRLLAATADLDPLRSPRQLDRILGDIKRARLAASIALEDRR